MSKATRFPTFGRRYPLMFAAFALFLCICTQAIAAHYRRRAHRSRIMRPLPDTARAIHLGDAGSPRLTNSARRFKRYRLLPVAGFILVLTIAGGVGSAFAYFTALGSGSARANVGNLQAISVVAATGTPSSNLLHGGTADLTLTLDNPNSYQVTITGVSQDGPVTVVGGSNCTSDSGTWPSITLGNSGVSVSSVTGLSTPLPNGTNDVDILNSVTMTTNSYTGCQGASFQIPVTVTVQK